MHVAIACGGTGGHAFPGVVTGQVLRRRGHAVTLWLAGRDAESSVIKDWDGPVVRLVARGFQEGWTAGGVGIALGHVRAAAQAFSTMRRARPDVLLGMGSYSTVPPALAARLLGVPVVLHEANAVPGSAISFLARGARSVGIAFATAAEHLPRTRTVMTGLPMRAFGGEILRDAPLREGVFTVLIMGGSQGAHALNVLAPAAVLALHRQGRAVQVIHLSGRADEGAVRAVYAAAGVPQLVFGFLAEIGGAYLRADLAVCRSGAGTCMELARCGLPAILVPLPTARRNHQWHNARELEQRGGARVIEQHALSEAGLAEAIGGFMEAPQKLAEIRTALKGMAIADGAERLADLVEAAGQSHASIGKTASGGRGPPRIKTENGES